MNGPRSGSAQLLCGLAILAALGGLLIARPGDEASGGGPSSATRLDARELARISVRSIPGVARRVERIRGLELERVPMPEVVASEYLNRLGVREFVRSPGADSFYADRATTRITGLLAPGEQLERAYDSTGELAAAVYDPRRDRLYVVADAVVPNRALVEIVLAHELDHALEDQRFGLPEARGASDDEALARTALVEGSATSVMADYGALHLSPVELLGAAARIDDDDAGVPKFALAQLRWAYLGGARFVTALRELAGGWKLVDYALRARPPASTEQVMHPPKYVHDERPLPTAIQPAALRAGGWRRADRGDLGELATRRLLRLGADQALARAAAAGWGGDSYELWRRDTPPAGCAAPCRADLVLAIAWRWDTAGDTAQFARAARAYARRGLGGRSARPGLWRIDGGCLALATGARASGLVFAPSARLARRVAAAQVTGLADRRHPETLDARR